MDRKLQKRIDEFCLKWGRKDAEARLVATGISKSFAEKLLSGNYDKPIRTIYMALLDTALGQK